MHTRSLRNHFNGYRWTTKLELPSNIRAVVIRADVHYLDGITPYGGSP